MTRRVVVTDFTFPDLAAERQASEAGGAAFESFQFRDAEAVRKGVAGADVALVQFAPLTEAAIAELNPGARVIRYGVGYDNVDVAAARKRGIDVACVPDYCIAEVADHTATLILTLLRRIVPLDRSVRAGQWAAVAVARPLRAFDETTIGFIGLGRIGRAVMDRLRGFGFRFLVFDPALTAAPGDNASLAESVDALLAASDAVTLHVPMTPTTRGMIDRSALQRMRPHAVLVNTARGGLIDEPALAAALADGRIAGAGLDVFGVEPLPGDSPLRTAPNLVMTPHAAWYSDVAITRLQALAADEVARALAGRPPRCPVPG